MATRYYAIKRPDGSWVMSAPGKSEAEAWKNAQWYSGQSVILQRRGYRCCEVSGFVEVENGHE